MGKYNRFITLVAADAILITISLYFALLVRFDGRIPARYMDSFVEHILLLCLVNIICFCFFKLYNRLWQYASIGELVTVIAAVTVGTTINISIVLFLMEDGKFILPRSVFVISWITNIILIGGSRLAWRMFRDYILFYKNSKEGRPVLIVGAGDAGVLVAKEMKRHYNGRINLVGFVDDDLSKQKLKVLGIPVLGDRNKIKSLVKRHGIKEIIIALPSVDGKMVREIVAICQQTQAELKILPGIYELIDGNVTIKQIREVQLEDLLGRDSVKVDLESISKYINNQVVLVTGAGGSIGSELCRQISKFNPKKLLLLDNCENNVYEIELALRKLNRHLSICPLVKDIRDQRAIEQVFKLYRPQVVFHSAAHKHVPLMEVNPEEAIKNNVLGTYTVAKSADLYGADKFVLISTDKAVNPVSIMGATKRVAEMIIQHLDKYSQTDYVAVRFGNVLGSKGSVVPLFKKQIAEGGPVTITHPEMERYFMTVSEAVQLVIQAGAMADGGEIFVLDMGEPVKITDLAESIIKLSGLEVGKDIDVVVTGMRPGERLYEELLTAEEGINATAHKRIFVARPNNIKHGLIDELTAKMVAGKLPKDKTESEALLKEFIPDFNMWEQKLTG